MNEATIKFNKEGQITAISGQFKAKECKEYFDGLKFKLNNNGVDK